MKTTKSVLCLFFLMLCSVNMQAFDNTYCCDQPFDSQNIDQVVVNEHGVFILVDGCWLSSQGMQITEVGIFILEDGNWMPLHEVVRCDNYYTWKCNICGACNPQGVSRCMNYKNHPK